MRTEDLDWKVYHLIVGRAPVGRDALGDLMDVDPDVLEGSLARLSRSFLIRRSSEGYVPTTIGEALVACQAKYAQDSPLIIEDGVIRARTKKEQP
ncbi:MAG: MarR family transcriptional regulator [Methanomicrobiaceae archaeon]|nr:MarR family transcriptional regulator [Methanomicrobiaceae archaeon]